MESTDFNSLIILGVIVGIMVSLGLISMGIFLLQYYWEFHWKKKPAKLVDNKPATQEYTEHDLRILNEWVDE